MALDERADAVTTVDGDEADAQRSALSVAPEAINGAGREAATRGNGAEAGLGDASSDGGDDRDAAATPAAPFAPPAPAATNGTGSVERARPNRKRTSKQRSLLLAETAAAADVGDRGDDEPVEPVVAAAPAAHLDPLLAAAAPDDGVEDAIAVEDTAAVELVAPTTSDDRAEPKAPPPPVFLPASATATALSAAVAFAPSPSVTEAVPLVAPAPLPVTEPDPNATGAPRVGVVPPPPRPRRRARPRVRKVTRIVRSVDAWSVFKVAIVFFTSMGVVLLTAGVLLWNLAQTTGTLDNVEGFFREAFQYDTFKLESEPVFKAGLTLIVLFIIVGTGMSVVMAVLFNLIADLTGGIRLTVLEREVVAREDVSSARVRRKRLRTTKRPPIAPATLPPDVPTPPPPG
jgi:hypothetical protein